MHERGRLLRQDPFDRPRRSFAAARSRESSLWVCDNDPYFVAITILSSTPKTRCPTIRRWVVDELARASGTGSRRRSAPRSTPSSAQGGRL